MSKKVSRSPDRHTFQKQGYIERCASTGKEPSQDYLNMWNNIAVRDLAYGENPEQHEHDMEYDMRTCEWICEKTRASDTYAQNLYAAMCNTDWQKREVLPILKDQTWSCTWRYAGGIIADMRGSGDYIDWYCSGIGDGLGNGDSDGVKDYVSEGIVTEEIADDLYKLGWVCKEHNGDQHD